MDPDTKIGGAAQRFPVTRHSAIVAARSDDREVRQRALGTIVESYWKPAYKYLRIKWQLSNEDTKDLVQGFFANAIEKNYFTSYDPAKASFQTFFRTCLDRFVANQKKSDNRLKRGGGNDQFSIDFSSVEDELELNTVTEVSLEDYFHKEWVRSLFTLAVETLRSRYDGMGRSVYFALFELYDLGEDEADSKSSYASLAKQFGLSTMDVTNYLAAARREFRKIVLDKLREVTATEEEFRTEARALLGVEVK
jgi:DNA-directed RNA polymerase specialized sigma24 family protein